MYNYFEDDYYRNNAAYYNCPFCQPYYEEYYRYEEEDLEEEYTETFDEFDEEQFHEDFYGDTGESYENMIRYPIYNEAGFRGNEEVEALSGAVLKEIMLNAKYIAAMPIARELIEYLVKEVVNYLNTYHKNYLDSMEKEVEALINAIKKDMYWVMEILAVFGVTPEMAANFIEDIVKAFLKQIMPVSGTENSPMWGV